MKKRLTVLGLIVITVILVITGPRLFFEFHYWKAKLAVGDNRYPVRMTIDAVIEKQPTKISTTFECYQRIRTDEGCFLCPEWETSIRQIAHQLPSGNWFLARLHNYCFAKEGKPASVRPRFSLMMWADDRLRPTVTENYTFTNLLSDVLPDDPKFLTHSFRFNFERLEPSNARPDDPDEQPPFKLIGVSKRKSGSTRQMMAGGAVKVIPKSLWSQLPFMEKLVRGISEPEEVSLTKEERFAIFRVESDDLKKIQEMKKINEIKSLRKQDVVHFIPFHPIGTDLWELDPRRAQISVKYYIGKYTENPPTVTINGQSSGVGKWSDRQRLFLDGKEFELSRERFVFDPKTQAIMILTPLNRYEFSN